jgi:hypothetical protein
MVKHAPGTYVVTVAEDGGETWLPAPSVVAEIVDGMDPIGPPEKDELLTDCSLDTEEGCDLWINRLWYAICDHRGGYLEADRAYSGNRELGRQMNAMYPSDSGTGLGEQIRRG